MVVDGLVRESEYFDSVTLMMLARQFNLPDKGLEVALVMATKENLAILERASMLIDKFSGRGDSDLLIVVMGKTDKMVATTLEKISLALDQKRKTSGAVGGGLEYQPKSLESGLSVMPAANLLLISVAGRYAVMEAYDALAHGLNVMLFSDNISIADEIKLKQEAKKRNLYLMGPDCGTAIIGGVPLAFANQVSSGSVGIVAASGTGLQEVSSLISNGGGGISHAIGTGGRDLKVEVGGITFLQGLQELIDDPQTKVIVLISKPAASEVLAKVVKLLEPSLKPVVALFQGADLNALPFNSDGCVQIASDLEDCAKLALAALDLTDGELFSEDKFDPAPMVEKMSCDQKYLRALFSGGTFCSESQLLIGKDLAPLFSNTPVGASSTISDPWQSTQHILLDLGDDQFTDGRPHPMIDFSIRNQRIIDEACDPQTAVVLLDLVLGYGANPDPLSELLPVINQAQQAAKKVGSYLAIICSVTGTDQDPQKRQQVVAALIAAGVVVAPSNARATLQAAAIITMLNKREGGE
ncbi:MAG: acyl-CoA synthetase FdrA [Bdellovibrionales bacterium]|nr:acyl-CoA synthetase FdrA [Bdellovibrionales bacterium]MBT3526807.1 acyl-CoA synthetase FdrA [Bdellovibrionales bacterium]MBT7766298.1 acyl-CoA synthetase FdrA [Bdellovibrionales bacterium]